MGDIISLDQFELMRGKNLGRKSVTEIRNHLINLNLDFGDRLEPWDKDIIIKLREELRKKVSETKKLELLEQDQLLEIELKRVLNEAIEISRKDLSVKERVIDVLNSRFGLDGSPAKTLEIIGQKYNVTRERIRQNESYGLRKLKFSKPITPILDKIFEILDQSLPITEIEFNRAIKEKGLTNFEWDVKGLQDFYESYRLKQDFYVSKINNLKVISKSSIDNIFRNVIKDIKKKISNSGLISLSDCMKIKEVYLNNIKKETIKKFIQTMPLFSWLDDDEEWFIFYSKRNRLSNLIAKAATATEQVNFEDLFNRIKNYHRLDDVLYSKNIFLEFCKKSFDCFEKNEDLVFNSSKSKISEYDGYKGEIISPNEAIIIKLFKDYGPILDWRDIKELSSKEGVREHSFNMIMQFSVLFKRIDKATYILTGEKLEKIKSKEFVKIDLMTNTFKKEDCPMIKNQGQFYIEVYKSKKYFKTIAYPQTLRKIDDVDQGILFNNKVYPIF